MFSSRFISSALTLFVAILTFAQHANAYNPRPCRWVDTGETRAASGIQAGTYSIANPIICVDGDPGIVPSGGSDTDEKRQRKQTYQNGSWSYTSQYQWVETTDTVFGTVSQSSTVVIPPDYSTPGVKTLYIIWNDGGSGSEESESETEGSESGSEAGSESTGSGSGSEGSGSEEDESGTADDPIVASTSFEVTVVKVDLGINNLPDDEDEPDNQGNQDNQDNANNGPAPNDMVPGGIIHNTHCTLTPLTISLLPTGVEEGELILSIESGDDKVTVYEDEEGETELILPKTWDLSTDEMPTHVFVAGNSTSDEGEVEFKLSYDYGGEMPCEDEIVATVIGNGRTIKPPPIGFDAKGRSVDFHGVPHPNPSPTGESEDDSTPPTAFVDMFNLRPTYIAKDFSYPLEGGELSLEMSRTATVTSKQLHNVGDPEPIIWDSDDILGPSWHTNITPKGILAREPNNPLVPDSLTLTDEVGNPYTFILTANGWVADTMTSFSNRANEARLEGTTGTITLIKKFGTRVEYTYVTTKSVPSQCGGGLPPTQDYYRVVSITDRNGNSLSYEYNSGSPYLPSKIFETAHPERNVTFGYQQITTPITYPDGNWRLTSVTDPLGRTTNYQYSKQSNVDSLNKILRPAVTNPVSGQSERPTVTFQIKHQVVNGFDPDSGLPDMNNRIQWSAPSSIRDPRGHSTSFSYRTANVLTAISLSTVGMLRQEKRLLLTSVSTADGTATFNGSVGPSSSTSVTDTEGSTHSYAFSGSWVDAPTLIGRALYVTSLTRSTNGIGSARYTWSADAFANLTSVTDISGNTINFAYTNPALDIPSSRVVDPGGLNISTGYAYDGTFNKLTQQVDGEGKVTTHTLDANGNRTTIIEPLGKTTQYTYEADGFISSMTDPDGRVTTFSRQFTPGNVNEYLTITTTVKGINNDVNLVSVEVRDVVGNVVKTIDPNGNVTTFEYDGLDRMVKQTNPAVDNPSNHGNLVTSTVENAYDLNGNLLSTKEDNGNVTVFTYDSRNRVTEQRRRMADPSANNGSDIVTSMTYTKRGQEKTVTDGRGNTTSSEYDGLLRLTKKTFRDGTSESYSYGANAGSGAFTIRGWQPTEVINRRGFKTHNTYDAAYRRVQTVRRSEGSSAAANSPAAEGEPTEIIEYNKVHNPILVTSLNEDADGTSANQETYTFYDDLHRPTVVAVEMGGDGVGAVAGAYVNDASTFGADALDHVTRTSYDLAGNTLTVTDAEGQTTTSTYDGASRVVSVTSPSVTAGTPVTTNVYDNNSNVIRVTDPNGNVTLTEYDARNRATRTVLDLDGDGIFEDNGQDIVTSTRYDLSGLVLEVTDPNGNVTSTTYDRNNRPVEIQGAQVADAEDSGALKTPITTTIYDDNDNVVEVVDPRGVRTVNEYDAEDRLTTSTAAVGTPVAVQTHNTYDDNGNVTSKTLVNTGNSQQTTVYEYDEYDRVTSETLPFVVENRVRSFTYDRIGNVLTQADPKGQTRESSYDRKNREAQAVLRKADNTIEETRTFVYDKVDNILSVSDIKGSSNYAYDDLYRVTSETRVTPGQANYTVLSQYDLNGNRTFCQYPETNRSLTSAYDRANRLTTVTDSVGNRNSSYTYDNNSNILSSTTPNGVVSTNTFDALNRLLTRAADSSGTTVYSATYGYDLANNRRTIEELVADQGTRNLAYAYDSLYRLTQEAWGTTSYHYEYDLAGNRTKLTHTVDGVESVTDYTYDLLNQLNTATKDGTSFTTYEYDLNGNQSSKTVDGSVSTYTWDTLDRLVHVDADGSTIFQAEYDYRTRRLTKTEGTDVTYFRYDQGNSFQEVKNGTLDAEFIRGSGMGGGIGSILYKDDTNQEEFFVYNAVGHTVVLTDTAGLTKSGNQYEAFGGITSTSGSSENNRLANTKERDASTGLDNHGFRYYDSLTGRYISRDPAEDGINLYVYVRNNPINAIDPLGLEAWYWSGARVVGNFTSGIADNLTFGLTAKLRTGYAARSVDTNSIAYKGGDVVADVGQAMTGGGALKVAVKKVAADHAQDYISDNVINLAVDGAEAAGLREIAEAARDAKNVLDIAKGNKKKGSKKANVEGGAHRQTTKPVNDKKDSHHMPDRKADPSVDPMDGMAIKMDNRDHKETSSYGSSREAVRYRKQNAEMIKKGQKRDVMAREIRDVRAASQKGSGNRRKYNKGIRQMLDYGKESGQIPKKEKK